MHCDLARLTPRGESSEFSSDMLKVILCIQMYVFL